MANWGPRRSNGPECSDFFYNSCTRLTPLEVNVSLPSRLLSADRKFEGEGSPKGNAWLGSLMYRAKVAGVSCIVVRARVSGPMIESLGELYEGGDKRGVGAERFSLGA